jgi:hypothetical protein
MRKVPWRIFDHPYLDVAEDTGTSVGGTDLSFVFRSLYERPVRCAKRGVFEINMSCFGLR